MKNIVHFVKTTVIGGLVVILPLAILAYFVGDAVNTLVDATKPLTTDLPFGPVINALIAVLVAAAIIIAICFAAGFLLSTFWGGTAKNWLEKNVFERIPMYSTLRGLTQRFAGFEDADYPVVEVDLYDSDSRVLGVLVDDLPDGRKMVYVPSSPVVTLGQLHILPAARVMKMELSMVETIGCLSQMGLEARKLYGGDDEQV
ncbi:MAG: DUF502 domain-containing protein [Pseudomonadota bacterium]